MTDNRTNEPTDEQVEAATQSLLEGADLQVFDVRRQEELRLRVRAALEAAAGAAPQTEMPGRQELGQTIRNKFNEARGRSGVDPWALADLILEEHPALAAPVQPSSTVDEEAIAARICEKNYVSPDGKPYCQSCLEEVRAVVEAIGGESR